MSIVFSRLPLRTLMAGALMLTTVGCVVPADGGYGYGYGGVGAAYYEPYGYNYGGWGNGYQVAPYRDGDHRQWNGGGGYNHAYRAAPASRSVPSIASHARSGGGHGEGRHR